MSPPRIIFEYVPYGTGSTAATTLWTVIRRHAARGSFYSTAAPTSGRYCCLVYGCSALPATAAVAPAFGSESDIVLLFHHHLKVFPTTPRRTWKREDEQWSKPPGEPSFRRYTQFRSSRHSHVAQLGIECPNVSDTPSSRRHVQHSPRTHGTVSTVCNGDS